MLDYVAVARLLEVCAACDVVETRRAPCMHVSKPALCDGPVHERQGGEVPSVVGVLDVLWLRTRWWPGEVLRAGALGLRSRDATLQRCVSSPAPPCVKRFVKSDLPPSAGLPGSHACEAGRACARGPLVRRTGFSAGCARAVPRERHKHRERCESCCCSGANLPAMGGGVTGARCWWARASNTLRACSHCQRVWQHAPLHSAAPHYLHCLCCRQVARLARQRSCALHPC